MTGLPTPKGSIWRLSFSAPEHATEAFEIVLDRFAGAISSARRVQDDAWTVEGYADAEPDRHSVETAIRSLARELDIEAPAVRFDPSMSAGASASADHSMGSMLFISKLPSNSAGLGP